MNYKIRSNIKSDEEYENLCETVKLEFSIHSYQNNDIFNKNFEEIAIKLHSSKLCYFIIFVYYFSALLNL